MYYGFRGLCEEFIQKHLGYTIYPVRINGSAVETFFSQVKHATSGHLSATNYATARSAVITRGSVHGKLRRHRGDYRNVSTVHQRTSAEEKKYTRMQ